MQVLTEDGGFPCETAELIVCFVAKESVEKFFDFWIPEPLGWVFRGNFGGRSGLGDFSMLCDWLARKSLFGSYLLAFSSSELQFS